MRTKKGAETSSPASRTAEAAFSPLREAVAGSGYAADSAAGQFPTSGQAGTRAPYEPLLIHNLLNDLATLGSLFLTAVRRESWLNAYLLAAGMNQIVEDYLHPDPYFLGKASGHLAHMRAPVGRPAAGTARSLAASISLFRSRRGEVSRISAWQADFAAFVEQLAAIMAGASATASISRAELLASAEAFTASLEHFPRPLLREVLRLPSCFRSFDQQPADLARIVPAFAERWPD
ncbi:MAG: hypothetical protein ACRDG4_16485, partial [Chloroflexota bacterium]